MTEPPNTRHGGGHVSPPIEALLATVRQAVDSAMNGEYGKRNALAALDAIASELEQYERVKKHYDGSGYTASWERASLMAELVRVRAERDAAQVALLADMLGTKARLDRAVEALREIADPENDSSELRRIARAALEEIDRDS